MLINVLSIVSWALIAVSSSTNFELMYTQILIARVVIGEFDVESMLVVMLIFKFCIKLLNVSKFTLMMSKINLVPVIP